MLGAPTTERLTQIQPKLTLKYFVRLKFNGVVGDTGIEPVTYAMSTRRSPAELIARLVWPD